jgi:predicted GIY-YIG superfamily endonuclease
MTIKTYIIEGVFRSVYKTDDFELELNLPKSALKIKGLSKKLLIEKKTELEKEHAIYILEGPVSCYVGQSTDVQSRMNNHKDKNKSDFSRCFILSKKDTDLRGYLDYMESYAIREMESLGYKLDNSKKPNPDEDILSPYKKEMANDWIDEFLSFLPILGFKKSPTPLPIVNQSITPTIVNNVITLKFNDTLIHGINNRNIFTILLQKIGLEIIEKQCSSIFGTGVKLSKIYEKPRYGSCHELKENNQNYYLYFNISKNDLCKKIIKIKEILKLNIEIL